MFVHSFVRNTFIALIKTQAAQNMNVRVVTDHFDTQVITELYSHRWACTEDYHQTKSDKMCNLEIHYI